MAGAGLTQPLALVIGGYLVLSSGAMLRRDTADAFFDDLAAHAGSVHAVGAVAFFVGATILAFHWQWSSLAEMVVSGVAAFWAFEGAGLLFSPARLQALMSATQFRRTRRLIDAVLVAVGLGMLAVSLR